MDSSIIRGQKSTITTSFRSFGTKSRQRINFQSLMLNTFIFFSFLRRIIVVTNRDYTFINNNVTPLKKMVLNLSKAIREEKEKQGSDSDNTGIISQVESVNENQ